jgi:hypothetical protein
MPENAAILALLETLQEYCQAQALLQSAIVDGYMELAQSRRVSTGLLVPDVLISPDSEKRTISADFRTIDDDKARLFVSGVSESRLAAVRAEFEKALQCVLQTAAIRQQCTARWQAIAYEVP